MPLLPSPNVTDAQAARILAAYKAKYGTNTTAETALEFKKEVIEMVRQTVLDYEALQMMERQNSERTAALQAINNELPKKEDVT